MNAQVVIARFNEDIGWADHLLMPVAVYDKGEPDGVCATGGCSLPNVGRESHTYLHHIVSNYDRLAEFTIFCQGKNDDHLPHGSTIEALQPTRGVVMANRWQGCEWDGAGYLRHMGPWRDRAASGKMARARLSMVEWFKRFVGVDIKAIGSLTYCEGAVFGVHRDMIRRRPKEYYARMLDSVSNHVEPEEAYYVERAWLEMFQAKPNEVKVLRRAERAKSLEESRVFLGVPAYESIVPQAFEGLMFSTQGKLQGWTMKVKPNCSLLAMGFNCLLCDALNTRKEHNWTHFAMHHADVEAKPGWLDVLVEEQIRTGADIVSTVIPIKDNRGVTSTCLIYPDGARRRLTMKEVHKLPETFGIDDIPPSMGGTEDASLAVNTGLWVADFTDSWMEPPFAFTIQDAITRRPDGKYQARTLPEDWNMSLFAARRGLKVMATRKAVIKHHGKSEFTNERPWGEMAFDQGD